MLRRCPIFEINGFAVDLRCIVFICAFENNTFDMVLSTGTTIKTINTSKEVHEQLVKAWKAYNGG